MQMQASLSRIPAPVQKSKAAMRLRQATTPTKISSTAHPNQQKSPGDDAFEATLHASAEREASALTAAAKTALYGAKPEIPDAEDDGVAWRATGNDEDEVRKARIHARGVERAEAKENATSGLPSGMPEESSVSGGKAALAAARARAAAAAAAVAEAEAKLALAEAEAEAEAQAEAQLEAEAQAAAAHARKQTEMQAEKEATAQAEAKTRSEAQAEKEAAAQAEAEAEAKIMLAQAKAAAIAEVEADRAQAQKEIDAEADESSKSTTKPKSRSHSHILEAMTKDAALAKASNPSADGTSTSASGTPAPANAAEALHQLSQAEVEAEAATQMAAEAESKADLLDAALKEAILPSAQKDISSKLRTAKKEARLVRELATEARAKTERARRVATEMSEREKEQEAAAAALRKRAQARQGAAAAALRAKKQAASGANMVVAATGAAARNRKPKDHIAALADKEKAAADRRAKRVAAQALQEQQRKQKQQTIRERAAAAAAAGSVVGSGAGSLIDSGMEQQQKQQQQQQPAKSENVALGMSTHFCGAPGGTSGVAKATAVFTTHDSGAATAPLPLALSHTLLRAAGGGPSGPITPRKGSRCSLLSWMCSIGINERDAQDYVSRMTEEGYDDAESLQDMDEEEMLSFGMKKGHLKKVLRHRQRFVELANNANARKKDRDRRVSRSPRTPAMDASPAAPPSVKQPSPPPVAPAAGSAKAAIDAVKSKQLAKKKAKEEAKKKARAEAVAKRKAKEEAEKEEWNGIKCFKQWKVSENGEIKDSLGRPLLMNCRRRMPHKCGPDCPFRREKKGHTKKGQIAAVTKWHKKQKDEVVQKVAEHHEALKKAAQKEANRKRHSPVADDDAQAADKKPVQNSPLAKRALDMGAVPHNNAPQAFY
eukprot:g2086.t1